MWQRGQRTSEKPISAATETQKRQQAKKSQCLKNTSKSQKNIVKVQTFELALHRVKRQTEIGIVASR